jgi:hypothetical protein
MSYIILLRGISILHIKRNKIEVEHAIMRIRYPNSVLYILLLTKFDPSTSFGGLETWRTDLIQSEYKSSMTNNKNEQYILHIGEK